MNIIFTNKLQAFARENNLVHYCCLDKCKNTYIVTFQDQGLTFGYRREIPLEQVLSGECSADDVLKPLREKMNRFLGVGKDE